MLKLHHIFGISGIHNRETPEARKWGNIFSYATTAVAIVLALQWHMELDGSLSFRDSWILDWAVWIYFLLQFTVLTSLVKDKRFYIRSNWLIVLILLQGMPIILHFAPVWEFLRSFRLLLVVLLLIPWIETCRKSLSDNRLATTLLSAAVITLLSGILISGFDPDINTTWDGIWWAWVTVSTIGYGDIVPSSVIGRIFAIGLIVMGLCLFAVLTANFSAIFVKRRVKEENRVMRKLLKEIEEIKKDENSLLELSEKLSERFDRLEHRLDTLTDRQEKLHIKVGKKSIGPDTTGKQSPP